VGGPFIGPARVVPHGELSAGDQHQLGDEPGINLHRVFAHAARLSAWFTEGEPRGATLACGFSRSSHPAEHQQEKMP
jgi:hypothetical protein